MEYNRQILEKYIEYKTKIDPVKPQTIKTIENVIKRLMETSKKNIREITQQDILNHIEHFTPRGRNEKLATFRAFFRWLYDLEKGDKLPDCIRKIKNVKIDYDEIQNRERIVSESEYQKLLDHSKPMHRALFELCYIMGTRPSEALSVNGNGVSYDGNFARVIIRESKTKTREIIHKGRLNHLMTWYESYAPFKDQKDKPLFVNYRKDHPDKFQRFTYHGFFAYLKNKSERFIGRKITPHDFRHTSISRDQSNGVPNTHIETKHGLVHGSHVMRFYDHNKNRNYEEWLNKDDNETEPTYDVLKKKTDEIEKLKTELKEITEIMQEKHEESEQKQKKYNKINKLYQKKIIETQQIMIKGLELLIEKYPKMKKPELLQELNNIKNWGIDNRSRSL